MTALTTTTTMMGEEVISKGVYLPVLYLLASPGISIYENSWDSLGRVFLLLFTTPPLKKRSMITKTTNTVGGGTGAVASRRVIGKNEPPSPILLKWCELTYIIISEGGSHV